MKPVLRIRDDSAVSEEWSQWFLLHGQLAETRDVVSVAENAALSLGVHSTHISYLLIRRGHKISLHELFLLCSLISFVYDTPIVPDLNSAACRKLEGAKSLHERLRRSTWRGLSAYGEGLAQSAEICEEIYSPKNFLLGRGLDFTETSSPHIPMPSSDKVRRGLRCYWNALLTVPVPGRLLNFWRAIESVTTVAERSALPSELRNTKLNPVFAYKASGSGRGRNSSPRQRMNTTLLLHNEAKVTLEELLGAHGTDEAAMLHLFKARRGKAAHADAYTLEHDDAEGLSEQIRDMAFIRCLARVALERHS